VVLGEMGKAHKKRWHEERGEMGWGLDELCALSFERCVLLGSGRIREMTMEAETDSGFSGELMTSGQEREVRDTRSLSACALVGMLLFYSRWIVAGELPVDVPMGGVAWLFLLPHALGIAGLALYGMMWRIRFPLLLIAVVLGVVFWTANHLFLL